MADRIIAEARDYGELLAALRLRANELNTTWEGVDELAGMPLRYCSKIFCPNAVKSLGKISMGAILGSLGLKLIVAEDAEMFARIRDRLAQRKNRKSRTGKPAQRNWVFADNPDLARQFQARWVLQTTQRQRRTWGLQGGRPRGKVRRGRRGD